MVKWYIFAFWVSVRCDVKWWWSLYACKTYFLGPFFFTFPPSSFFYTISKQFRHAFVDAKEQFYRLFRYVETNLSVALFASKQFPRSFNELPKNNQSNCAFDNKHWTQSIKWTILLVSIQQQQQWIKKYDKKRIKSMIMTDK